MIAALNLQDLPASASVTWTCCQLATSLQPNDPLSIHDAYALYSQEKNSATQSILLLLSLQLALVFLPAILGHSSSEFEY
jgi:hypothetical protein